MIESESNRKRYQTINAKKTQPIFKLLKNPLAFVKTFFDWTCDGVGSNVCFVCETEDIWKVIANNDYFKQHFNYNFMEVRIINDGLKNFYYITSKSFNNIYFKLEKRHFNYINNNFMEMIWRSSRLMIIPP